MSTFLTVMVSNAVVATALAILVLVAQRWICQPAVRHTLWVIVLLKLVTPPLWHPELQWLPAVAQQFEVTAISETTAAGVGADRSQRDPGWSLAEQTAGAAAPTSPLGRPEQPSDAVPNRIAMPEIELVQADRAAVATRLPLLTSGWPKLDFVCVAASLWIAGVALWFLLAIQRVLRFQRCLRFAEAASDEIQFQTARLGAQLGLKRVPRVWRVPGRVPPMLWVDAGQARLIVPTELFAELDEAARETLLLHELAHYRRGDHWVRYLELVTTVLYWWHPLMWLVRRELRVCEELACDAWVVSRRPDSRRIYAEMLMQTIEFLSGETTPVLASGIGTEGRVEGRLVSIMRDSASVTVSRWAKFALLALGLSVLLQTPALVRAQLDKKQVHERAVAGEQRPDSMEILRAIKRAGPSVVQIKTVKNVTEKMVGVGAKGSTVTGTVTTTRAVNGFGSGFVIDPRGYLVTARHVVADANSVRISLGEGSDFEARVLVSDPKSDLAIIKIEATQPLTVMPLGTSTDLKVGQTVITVQTPAVQAVHVTFGILSSLARDVEVNDSLSYQNLLQFDVGLPPGSSGSLLLNQTREIIGMNVAMRAGAQRIGYAIPIDEVRRGIAALLRKLQTTQHGIVCHDVKQRGERPRLVIDGTDKGSIASKSGFQTGDVIVQAGSITVSDQADFERALLGRVAGEEIPIVIVRKDQRINLTLQLAQKVGQDKPDAIQPPAETKKESSQVADPAKLVPPREHVVIVQDDSGNLVPGIEVVAYSKGVRQKQTFRTGANGEIIVPGGWSTPGQNSWRSAYLVARDGDSRIGWVHLGNPTILRRADAPGQVFYQPFRMILLPRVEIVTGVATDESGRLIPNIRIGVMTWNHPVNGSLTRFNLPEPIAEATTDAQGRFYLKVPAKLNIWLESLHPDWQTPRLIKKPEQKDLGRITLMPAGRIEGRVVDAVTGKPRSGERVYTQTQSSWRSNSTTPVVTYAHAVTDADGRYLLGGLSATRYNVLYGGLVTEAQHSKKFLAPAVEGVEVEIGKTKQADFRVELGQRVTGQVIEATSGKPIEKVSVDCYGPSHPKSGGACRSDHTAADGTFEFYVLPGISWVYVADGRRMRVPGDSECIFEVVAGHATRPIVLKASAQQELPHSLARKIKAEIRPNPPRTYDLPVRLQPPAGRKVNAVYIRHVFVENSYSSGTAALAGESFPFSFHEDDKGKTYFLVVDATGFATARSAQFVVNEKMPEVVIPLVPEQLVSVRSRVVDRNQKPVAGARVRLRGLITGAEEQFPWGQEYESDKDGRFEIKHARVGDKFRMQIDYEGTAGQSSSWISLIDNTPRTLPDVMIDELPPVLRGMNAETSKPKVASGKFGPKGFSASNDLEGRFRMSGVTAGPVSVEILPQAFPVDPRAKSNSPNALPWTTHLFTMKLSLVSGDPLNESAEPKREILTTPNLNIIERANVPLKFGPGVVTIDGQRLMPEECVELAAEWQKDGLIKLQFTVPRSRLREFEPTVDTGNPPVKKVVQIVVQPTVPLVLRVKPGEAFKVRLSASSPTNQTWIEGAVIAVEQIAPDIVKQGAAR